jgi:hypothetical protein
MHSHHTVLDLAAAAAPLPLCAHRLRAAFGDCRFVDNAHGVGMSMLLDDDLLAALSQPLLVPLDGFQKAL